MYACNGVLFNHESPRRGETFVTRKITRGLARVDAGLDDCLYMGNLDSLRDWGHARDYVEMQWLMLQQGSRGFRDCHRPPGEVRRFIELTAQQLGWGPMQWDGEGTAEVGRRGDTGEVVIRIVRAISVRQRWRLLGDPAKPRTSWVGSRRNPGTGG